MFFKSKAQGALEYLLLLAGMAIVTTTVLLTLSNDPVSTNLPYQIANGLCAPYSFGLCPTADPDGNPNYYLCKWDSASNKCIAKRCSDFSADECPTDQHCKLEYNQCIPLYSHAKYQFSLEEELEPTTFHSGSTSDITASPLSSGKFMIFYRVYEGGSFVPKYAIWDYQANIIKEETTLHSSFYGEYVYSAKLKNGNIVYVYTNKSDNKGYFDILDEQGNFVVNASQFDANRISKKSVGVLENGNFVISYYDNNNHAGYFIIYSPSGSVVKSKTVFREFTSVYGGVGENKVLPLSNGNFMIAYIDSGSANSLYFKIFSADGSLIKDKTYVNGQYTSHVALTQLSNGNIVIAYQDYVQFGPDPGKFVVYDASGNLVKEETTFETNETRVKGVLAYPTGEFLIFYQDKSDSSGYIKVFNSDYTLKKDKTLIDGPIFTSGYAAEEGPFLLSNSKTAFVYYRSSIGGGFAIWS